MEVLILDTNRYEMNTDRITTQVVEAGAPKLNDSKSKEEERSRSVMQMLKTALGLLQVVVETGKRQKASKRAN